MPRDDGACCACLTVYYDPAKHDDGSLSERWMCVICASTFVRESIALARVEALEKALRRVVSWTHEYGDALKPLGADTYGEGMRDAKSQVAALARLEWTR